MELLHFVLEVLKIFSPHKTFSNCFDSFQKLIIIVNRFKGFHKLQQPNRIILGHGNKFVKG